MGMMTFRPGQRLVIPGVQVFAPGGASSAASTWWDNNGAISGCVAAYAPKGATSLAASYTNLTGNATYNAAPGVAPTWDATGGWTFNGSTQHLTTGVVPVSGATMIVRFSNAATGTFAAIAGSRTSTGDRRFYVAQQSGPAVLYGHGGIYTQSATVTSGVSCVAGQNAYYNGSSLGTIATTPSAAFLAIVIGANNLDGVVTNFFSGKIQALAIYSVALTAGQVATITTAMQAL